MILGILYYLLLIPSLFCLSNFLFRNFTIFQKLLISYLFFFLFHGVMVQILSIINKLNQTGIFLFVLFFSLIVMYVLRNSLRTSAFSYKLDLSHLFLKFSSLEPMLKILCISYLIAFITIFSTSWMNFPSYTDSYHWEMPYYWLKNETIKPFTVLNFRTVSFSFLHEAQFVPIYAFFKNAKITFVITAICFLFLPFVIKNISLRIGFSENASIFSALVVCSFTVILQGFHNGSNDLSNAFWILVCIYFILEFIHSKFEKISFLIISVLSFCVALGIKNTVIILTPIYGLILLYILIKSSSQNRVKILSILILNFCIGIFMSTFVWLYVNNYLWYGDLLGFKANYQTAVGALDFGSIKGRIIRGILYMISDYGYLPSKIEKIFISLHKIFLDFFDVPDVLKNEGSYYSYVKDRIPQRNAFGIAGSIFIIPVYLISLRKFLFDKQSYIYYNKSLARIIIYFSSFSFIIYHAFLNWQPPGLFRLCFVFILVFAPLFAVCYDKLTLRRAISIFVILNYIFMTLVLVFISIPPNIIRSNQFLQSISNLRLSSDGEFIFDDKVKKSSRVLVLKDYANWELLQNIEKFYIKQGATVAYIGCDEYFLFGKEMSNKIESVIDHRIPLEKAIQRINFNHQYVIIQTDILDKDSKQFLNIKILNEGYTLILSVVHKKSGIERFLVYKNMRF